MRKPGILLFLAYGTMVVTSIQFIFQRSGLTLYKEVKGVKGVSYACDELCADRCCVAAPVRL